MFGGDSGASPRRCILLSPIKSIRPPSPTSASHRRRSDSHVEGDELLQPAAAPDRRPSATGVREGRLPAAGVSSCWLPTSAGLPAAGVPAAVRATAAPESAEQRAFLRGRMFGGALLLLPFGCMLLRTTEIFNIISLC